MLLETVFCPAGTLYGRLEPKTAMISTENLDLHGLRPYSVNNLDDEAEDQADVATPTRGSVRTPTAIRQIPVDVRSIRERVTYSGNN